MLLVGTQLYGNLDLWESLLTEFCVLSKGYSCEELNVVECSYICNGYTYECLPLPIFPSNVIGKSCVPGQAYAQNTASYPDMVLFLSHPSFCTFLCLQRGIFSPTSKCWLKAMICAFALCFDIQQRLLSVQRECQA